MCVYVYICVCIYLIEELHLCAVYFLSQKTEMNYLAQHVVSIGEIVWKLNIV